jgi:hypothetical protein
MGEQHLPLRQSNVEQSSIPKGAYLGAALGQRTNRHGEEGDPGLSTSSSIDKSDT